MASDQARRTTITVTERTRRLLEAVKASGESFDDLILELVEDSCFDAEFCAEIGRRWNVERRVPGQRVLKKAGLAQAPVSWRSSSRPRRSSRSSRLGATGERRRGRVPVKAGLGSPPKRWGTLGQTSCTVDTESPQEGTSTLRIGYIYPMQSSNRA